jgi:hypothetical protein
MLTEKQPGQQSAWFRAVLAPHVGEHRPAEPRALPLACSSVLCTREEPSLLVALTPVEPNISGGTSLYALSVAQAMELRHQLGQAINRASNPCRGTFRDV